MNAPAASSHSSERLTDEQYWTSTWTRRRVLDPARWASHPAVRAMAAVIEREVQRLPEVRRSHPRILEVGSADSYWLPYAARHWNANVTGIDFSPVGCEQAEEQLARQGLKGTIICGDFFEEVTRIRDIDLVISFGFVEHFSPPRLAIGPMRQCLGPDGRFFAAVPNLAGVYGPLQWLLNPEVYHAHIRLSAEILRAEAVEAGLAEATGGYCGGPLHFGVLNFAKGRTEWLSKAMRQVGRGLSVLDRGIAAAADRLGGRLDTAWFSPHAYVVGARGRIDGVVGD